MLPLNFICAYVVSKATVLKNKKDDEGATAVEYGLLVSLVALVIIVGATAFGSKISALFSKVADKIIIPA